MLESETVTSCELRFLSRDWVGARRRSARVCQAQLGSEIGNPMKGGKSEDTLPTHDTLIWVRRVRAGRRSEETVADREESGR